MILKSNKALEWRFGRPQSKRSSIALLLVISIVLLSVWELLGFFTKPSYVVVAIVTDFERILSALLHSTKYVVFGVVFGGVLGSMVGIVLATFARISGTSYLLAAMVIAFPKTAMFFVFVGQYGVLSDKSLYAMTFYSVYIFMMFMAMGLMRTETEVERSPRLEVSVQLFSSRFEIVWYTLLPNILPTLFSNWAYISIGLWPSLIFFEPTGTPTASGIGNYIYGAFQSGWWDQFFAGSVVLMFPGVLTALLLLQLRKRFISR